MMNFIDWSLLAQATPAAAGGQGGGSLMDLAVPLVGFGVIFYFLIIRPQRKREKDHQALVGQLKTGDAIITGSGIHGRVANVKEKTVMLKVADNVKIEIEKSAVTTVIKAGGAGEAAPAASEK
jgi:preprotein translocase subunit YajC